MKRRPSKLRVSERGVALMLVVISIAILTVVGTEFAYNSRVDLQLATNQRDEVRAYYLARSAIGLSRLLLKFQRQVDQIQLPDIAGMLGKLAGGGQAQGTPPAQPTTLSIQLWRMAKVDCYMLQALVVEEKNPKSGLGPKSSPKFDFDDENPDLALKQKQRSFGGFEGCFDAKITDEEEKINLNKFNAPVLNARPAVGAALELFGDKRFEFLFEKEDSNKVKVTPSDVVIAIRDWTDEDQVQSALNLAGQVTEPFTKGFSDENYPYDKFNPRYKAKSGRFDTLDELYMVHGVNDRFMAAFRDRLTVYPDVNSRLNVNTDDPVMLYMAVLAVADPARMDPRLRDPVFVDTLIQKIRTARMFAMFGMSVTDFVNVVQSAGVAVNSSILNNPRNQQYVGDKSSTFKIVATGEAGAVQKKITAIVALDDGLGKLVYWREE
ncbi:MAG: type II secretion system minor pseudopilin [Myxococcaceae bacterium]